MIVTYCDGCDQQIKANGFKGVIATKLVNGATRMSAEFDFCETCMLRFEKVDPGKWPREVRD
jgi:hypothetical protein